MCAADMAEKRSGPRSKGRTSAEEEPPSICCVKGLSSSRHTQADLTPAGTESCSGAAAPRLRCKKCSVQPTLKVKKGQLWSQAKHGDFQALVLGSSEVHTGRRGFRDDSCVYLPIFVGFSCQFGKRVLERERWVPSSSKIFL